MPPQIRLDIRNELKLYAYIPIPCKIGTVVAPSPIQFMMNLSATGSPIHIPNSIETEIGIILKVYVKSFGSSY